MKKKYFLISTTTLLTFLLVSNDVEATTKTGEEQKEIIKQEENNIANYQTEMEKRMEEISKLEFERSKLQEEIDTLQEEIDTRNEKIKEINRAIFKKELEIKILEFQLDDTKTIVSRNLKIIEQKGDMKLIEFILSSESFTEIFSKYQVLSIVQKEHQEQFRELETISEKFETYKRELNKERANIENEKLSVSIVQGSILTKQTQLNKQKEEIDRQYNELENKTKQSKETIKQMILEVQEIEEAIRLEEKRKAQQTLLKQELKSAYSKYDEMFVSEITGTDVVDIAYKWVQERGLGSNNPVIYSMPRRQLTLAIYGDCSAFTRRVYMDAGYGHIGYTTADQIANPKGELLETVEELQPGDLMYFGPTGSHAVNSYLPDGRRVTTAHVAIYVGDNKMIDLASGVGTISIKEFGSGSKWENYVKTRWVGGKRFYK